MIGTLGNIVALLALITGMSVVSLHSSPTQAASQKGEASHEVYSSKLQSKVLATVGPESITYGRLEKAFQKNMNRKSVGLWQVARDSVVDFLDLYVNYRLKVQDAKGRKVDQDPEVVKDIRQNRDALAQPYFFEKKLTDPYVSEIMKRRKYELKVAVILVGRPSGEQADTTAAYQRAMSIIDLLQQGSDFATIARDSSEDVQSRSKGGELPFITGGMILRVVEDAAFALKPGEFSQTPIPTKYGYFIIKLLSKHKREKVRAGHILIATREEQDSAAAYRIADSVYKLLKSGSASFEDMAKSISEDQRTAVEGGDLGKFYDRSLGLDGGGRLMPEFVEAMYSLRDGEISKPVSTVYGSHIVRRIETAAIDEATEREDVKKQYKKQYFEKDKADLLEELKAANGYRWDESVLQGLLSHLDTTRTTIDSAWSAKVPEKLFDQTLYQAGAERITVGAFIDTLNTRPDYRGTALNRRGFSRVIRGLTEQELLTQVTADLETTYPDFGELMKEFRDGILIFRVEDEEVWSKLTFDSVKAHRYYDSTKSHYMTEEMYDISEIFALDDSTAQSFYQRIQNGENFDTLAAQHTMRRAYRELSGNWGAVTATENQLAAALIAQSKRVGYVLKPIKYENGYSIVRLNKVLPARQKTYDEALPDFAGKYQDLVQARLSKAWLDGLRKQYPVSIRQDVIDDIW